MLEKDFKAADIKWSMFVSAAFSFRYESCLRPFPPAFMKNGIKDMDQLVNLKKTVYKYILTRLHEFGLFVS